MSKQRNKRKTIEKYFANEPKKDKNTQSEDEEAQAPASKDSKKNRNWAQAMTELKKDFETQMRELEEKLGKERREMQEKHENEVSSLVKEIQKIAEENSMLKTSLGQMDKTVQKVIEEKNALKSKIGQMEKEIRKLSEENKSFRQRIEFREIDEFTRNQESIIQNQKNEKLEENVKYLIEKTTDMENRLRKDNLKIIGIPESHDQEKSLDIIFKELLQQNCPDILEAEGKIEMERIHQSPRERDHKKPTPRNIIAKFQNSQVKEKILQAARRTQFKYRGAAVRITQDLAATTLEARRAWNTIYRKAKELRMQPRMNYPARLNVLFQGKRWTFNEPGEFQMFLLEWPELNRRFDLHIQDSGEAWRLEERGEI
ncbi:uncharacterized protein LOC141499684 [Macrotis lagotis]|uniref:uncharacterized protein LOC141499684 n=1 Tax=Macrotis lagotis TaxID=92651 RepID=UPI003D6923FC